MSDLLLEIGLEEVPARMIASAQAELLKRVTDLLTREHLLAAGHTAHSYSTPRRLAVHLTGVLAHQPDITEELTGPAVKIAFKDGAPTPAAEAFARKSGLTVADLKTITTPKGDYLAASVTKKGRSVAEVLTTELPREIAALYWAKNMRWIPGSNQTFVRPVLWLVCLLDDAIVPTEFGGRTAGRATFGHRVLSTGEPFDIQSPASYLAQLEGEYVLADVEARRHKIRKALDRVTRDLATRAVPGARWREDEPLVDAVTHLTEWPDVLLGSFEPAYLDLPEEVLVTVMRDHQKYFALESSDGKLAPYFLTVTNIALDATNTPIIKQGNERVLRARFNDARFFWEFDQRTPLTDRVKLLENVTFQKDLGSYAKKSDYVGAVAQNLVVTAIKRGATLDSEAISVAARLAKTDLTTELVKEFTELQGVIGGIYARHQGISAVAADAIYDQYRPSSVADTIPRSSEGCLLGIADRITTIAGMFNLGLEPTGSKDPFALRRAANGIVRILAESSIPLKISHILNAVTPSMQTLDKLSAFFSERIDFYLRESLGLRYDVVNAVMKPGYDDLRELIARGRSVTEALGGPDFIAVCRLNKRAKNILTQANFVSQDNMANDVKAIERLGLNDPQVYLSSKAMRVGTKVHELCKASEYREALKELATLGPDVDAFFDSGVRIMDDDLTIRGIRLLLLAQIVADCSEIADFSEIVTTN